MASTAGTGERAIAGVTHGLIGLDQTVTWQGRHFGVMQTHESRITKYERPRYFQDVMVRGAFRSFQHDHYFEPREDGGTLMRDELRFAAPCGPLGRIAEVLVLRRYLTRFLTQRNRMIQQTAEAPEDGWRRYIGATISY
jgi:ligand-binding SRPBCC domain-containing protein